MKDSSDIFVIQIFNIGMIVPKITWLLEVLWNPWRWVALEINFV
jgi:hypothetical protein